MKNIHDVIRSETPTNDSETIGLIRASVLECKPGERPGWLKQLELSLDGYGGAMSQRAERVRALIKEVESEMTGESGQFRSG